MGTPLRHETTTPDAARLPAAGAGNGAHNGTPAGLAGRQGRRWRAQWRWRPRVVDRNLRVLILGVLGYAVSLRLASPLLAAVAPGQETTIGPYVAPGTMLVIWAGIAFLVFLFALPRPAAPAAAGAEGESTLATLAEHRTIWATLALTVVGALLISLITYGAVVHRLQGLRADAVRAADVTRGAGGSLRAVGAEGRGLVDGLARFDRTPSEAVLNDLRQSRARLQRAVLHAQRSAPEAAALAAALVLPEPAGDAGSPLQQSRTRARGHIRTITQDVAAAVIGLGAAMDRVDSQVTALPAQGAPAGVTEALRDVLATEIVAPAERAAAATEAAAPAFGVLNPAPLPLFVWVGGLYALYVFFPWALLLLFLFRRRSGRVQQIYNDLHALGYTDDDLFQLLQPDSRAGDPVAPPADAGRLAVEVRRRLVQRAFSPAEYVTTVALLSAASALGWYYVFYPQEGSGLAAVVSDGQGIRGLAAYLTQSVTPVTFGFVGASFYIIQMLMSRYFAADLYPGAFLQALERLLIVFIISLVLSIISGIDSSYVGALAALLAFLAGVFPAAAIGLVTRRVNRMAEAAFPTAVETAPLSVLDGINLWTEARLREEGVDNVHGLIGANLRRLVIRSPYSAAQIVDWVDQAVLYVHAGRQGELFPELRRVGIRNASDLLTASGLALADSEPPCCIPAGLDPARVRRVARAVDIAQSSTAPVEPALVPSLRAGQDVLGAVAGAADGAQQAQAALAAAGGAGGAGGAPAPAGDPYGHLRRTLLPDVQRAIAALEAALARTKTATAGAPLPAGRSAAVQGALERLTAAHAALRDEAAGAVEACRPAPGGGAEGPPQAPDAATAAVTRLRDAAIEAEGTAGTLLEAIGGPSPAPRLAPDVIRVLYDAMWPDPNMRYVLAYLRHISAPRPKGRLAASGGY